jgi:glycosyltransferase involved in cell wall biosynthesis
MIYRLFLLKRWLEDLLIRPFIWLGRARADKYPLQEQYEMFFFFPFYHTGGAEKVHAQLAQVFMDRKCLVLFTRRSHDNGFRTAFEQAGHRVLDISAYTDDKRRYWKNLIWRGVVTAHINRQHQRPLIINGQCNFAYKCAPWLHKDIPQLELIHSFNSFSWIRIPFLPFIRQTVMISRKAIADHTRQYARLGIPGQVLTRIRLVQNGVPLPKDAKPKSFDGTHLRVLYVGRATPEKRVHLVAEAAIRCREAAMPVSFSFLGDIQSSLSPSLQDAGYFYGMVDDPQTIRKAYDEHHILVITSSEEGFPMVVMEAMAMGCIILATPVGDLPHHIHTSENGMLFNSTDEKTVLDELPIFLDRLRINPEACARMSAENIAYAKAQFGMTTFAEAWRQLAAHLMNKP